MNYGTPPYSDARRLGQALYLSGQLGWRDGVLGDGIAVQTELALTGIKRVLEDHGATMSDVVKCQVYLSSMDDWPAMNEVYRTFFDEPYPARSAFACELYPGALVEIEAIAQLPS